MAATHRERESERKREGEERDSSSAYVKGETATTASPARSKAIYQSPNSYPLPSSPTPLLPSLPTPQERPRLPLITVLSISKPPPLFVQLLPNEALRRCRLTLASFPAATQQLQLGFRASLLSAELPPVVLGARVVRWLLEQFEMCDGSASILAHALQVGWVGQLV